MALLPALPPSPLLYHRPSAAPMPSTRGSKPGSCSHACTSTTRPRSSPSSGRSIDSRCTHHGNSRWLLMISQPLPPLPPATAVGAAAAAGAAAVLRRRLRLVQPRPGRQQVQIPSPSYRVSSPCTRPQPESRRGNGRHSALRLRRSSIPRTRSCRHAILGCPLPSPNLGHPAPNLGHPAPDGGLPRT